MARLTVKAMVVDLILFPVLSTAIYVQETKCLVIWAEDGEWSVLVLGSFASLRLAEIIILLFTSQFSSNNVT